MNTKATAKDFFLHLGAIISFYSSAIALVSLLFQVIIVAYPKVANNYYYSNPTISFQVATLIVAFPLFLFLSWQLHKMYTAEPALLDLPVRKWLSYITLFVAGAVTAGDLISLIYMFLDGQELTTSFILKVVTLFVVAGGIFLYYLREIRNVILPTERNIWRAVSLIIIVASIIIGFSVLGSPATQRAKRYDSQRVSDLQNIQWQVVSYFQRKGSLPTNLSELQDGISGYVTPADPKTNKSYEYTLVGQSAKAFQLCATFERSGNANGYFGPSMPIAVDMSAVRATGSENWQHIAGHQCFDRSIDPQLYPPVKY